MKSHFYFVIIISWLCVGCQAQEVAYSMIGGIAIAAVYCFGAMCRAFINDDEANPSQESQ